MDENRVREIFQEEMMKQKILFNRPMQILDGNDIVLGRTQGTRIGTSATQKVGVFGATPVVQAGAITSPNSQGVAYNQTDANTLKTAIDAIILAIKNFGITA